MTARILLLKSRASPDMLPFSLCYKTCNSAHDKVPLSNDTIDSVRRHLAVGRAKGLSAPPRNSPTERKWLTAAEWLTSPIHVGARGRLITWRPFKPNFFKLLQHRTTEQGWRIFLRASAQIRDNFWKYSFVCRNLSLASHIQLFQFCPLFCMDVKLGR